MASNSDAQTTSPSSERLVAISNSLGFKLLSELVKERAERNILISPCGLAFALLMIYNGAGGDTRQALEDVLSTRGLSLEEINDGSLSLLKSSLESADEPLLTIANALWVNEKLRFHTSFAQTVKRFYASEVSALNFDNPAALTTINEWAEKQTNGKIKTLLDQNALSPSTDCVLASAVYFKGAWTTPFPLSATRDDNFYLPDGRALRVPMMQQEGHYNYLQTAGFQALSLPYDDGRLSMFFFLPAENSSLEELSQRINKLLWEEWLTQFTERRLKLSVPRFKLSYEVEMCEQLGKLGLGIMFGCGADFSPMGLNGHYIEQFKHKTMVEVNEEGTEAAAAAMVIMGRRLPPSLSFNLNRPFLCVIRDNVSRLLIFIGLVVDPGSYRFNP